MKKKLWRNVSDSREYPANMVENHIFQRFQMTFSPVRNESPSSYFVPGKTFQNIKNNNEEMFLMKSNSSQSFFSKKHLLKKNPQLFHKLN